MPQEPENIQKIDIGDLTQNVTAAVQRAIEGQTARPPFGRIIIGLIFEPPVQQ
jgi:hypothetical protein